MFKILIVEDNVDKLKYVMQLLEKIDGIDIDLIDHELDALAAKAKLKNKFYDLMIVDIAIPAKKSANVDMDGGIKLLQEVLNYNRYNIPAHIIGLTALDEVFKTATQELNSQVISVIRYSDTDDEWQSALKNGITQWIDSKIQSIQQKIDYNYDVAIITAVEVEFSAVKRLSNNWKRVDFPNDATIYWETMFEGAQKEIKVIAANSSQMGMTASAVLSMKIIQNFRPKYLMMPGIAATVKNNPQYGYGDVMIIDESWDGGAGKITEDADGRRVFQPVALHLRGDKDLIERAKALMDDKQLLREIKDSFAPGKAPNTELSIHIGSVISVAGVIENSEVTKELIQQDRKLLGLEMESYGMYYSAANCSNPKPRVLAMKSISDFATPSKKDEYQPYGSHTSTRVMFHLIINECDFSS